MLSRLFIAALLSPAGKGLTSWLLFVMLIVLCALRTEDCQNAFQMLVTKINVYIIRPPLTLLDPGLWSTEIVIDSKRLCWL